MRADEPVAGLANHLEHLNVEVRERDELFRQMAENIVEVFWISSPDKQKLIYISPGYEKIWGRTCASLYQHPISWLDAIHPEDRERVRLAAMQKQISGAYDEEYRIIRPDGELRWISDRAYPVRNHQGEIYRIVGVAADITQRRQAEEMLQRTNRQLAELNASLEERVRSRTLELQAVIDQLRHEKRKTERIIHQITDGVIVTDNTPRILLINPAAHEMLFGNDLDHQPASLTEIPLLSSMHEIIHKATEMVSWEMKIFHPDDGGSTTLNITAIPLADTDGQIFGRVAVLHDVTSYKEVDRLKSEFIAQVSHDLRTPLTSIKGYIENLNDRIAGDLTERQQDYLVRMNKNANKLMRLINELLDVSRVESGKLEMSYEEVSLRDLILEAMSNMQQPASDKNVRLMATDLSDNGRIRGDGNKLEQVLTNILENAIKFTPAGGQITVSLQRENGFLRTSVKDTGIGIPPDEQARVFDRFHRGARAAQMQAEGAGLGLFIARSIVETHGGKIWITSKTGGGSEVSFTLPVIV